MKKVILSLAFFMMLTSVPFSTSAESYSIKEMFYNTTPKTSEYYAVDRSTFNTRKVRGQAVKANYILFKLSDDQYYKKADYITNLVRYGNFSEAMSKLASSTKQQTKPVTTKGKFARDGSVISSTAEDTTVAPPPVVKEFKVVDIK